MKILNIDSRTFSSDGLYCRSGDEITISHFLSDRLWQVSHRFWSESEDGEDAESKTLVTTFQSEADARSAYEKACADAARSHQQEFTT